MLIHNYDSQAQPLTVVTWYDFLLYYALPVLVNLVVLILIARHRGHWFTGEFRPLQKPEMILVFSILWPLMDGLVFYAGLFWVLSKGIAPLVRPVNPPPRRRRPSRRRPPV